MGLINSVYTLSSVLKDIVVINSTHTTLNDFYLTYGGSDKPALKISNLPNGQQLKKSLLVSHLLTPTKLMLIYYKDGEQKEIVAYDNLSRDDLRTLNLNITMVNDHLNVTATEE